LCLWGLIERQSDLISSIMPMLAFLGRTIVADPRHYRVEVWTICYDSFLWMELRLSMILILLIGPSLISQDLRFNSLPLYFSRPLGRLDYFVGKLGVIAVFLGAVTILPCLISYILGLAFSLDGSILHDTYRILLASLGYGLVIVLSAGALILALSSLSRNSRYIALFWVGLWFVSSVVGTVLDGVNHEQQRHEHFQRLNRPPRWNGDRRQWAREQREWQAARDKMWADIQKEEFESAKSDWRPLFSYTANLSRIGEHLLGTNHAWQEMSLVQPPDFRPRFLLTFLGPQYPWYWSAGVLAGLFGLSAWILNAKIKSLDRLR
jgi:ABC-2 type transport system permease protein